MLTGSAPVLTALACATVGAVAIEVIRYRGKTSGDVALAILFYGGIAGGVVIISQAPGGTPGNLNTYLFGAITTTSRGDVVTFAALSAVVLTVTLGLGRYLFAVSHDEEFARASGLPVLAINLALALVTAITVVVSMRVVGLLLISALMIVPVATAQLVARSFRSTVIVAVALGVARVRRRDLDLLRDRHALRRHDRARRDRGLPPHRDGRAAVRRLFRPAATPAS